MLAVQEDPLAGFALLLRAMRAAAAGKFELQTYLAMGVSAAVLHHRGFSIPARGLASFMCEISPNDGRTKEMLDSFSQDIRTPLSLRDDPFSFPPPEGASWQGPYMEAIEAYSRCDWLTLAERFEALAAEQADSPSVWRNLANARSLVGDNPGAIEALRRFSALRSAEENGTEDAADAEETSDAPLRRPTRRPRGNVAGRAGREGCRTRARILAFTRRFANRSPSVIRSSTSYDMTPPKAVFMLRDRPMPGIGRGLESRCGAAPYGQVMLFGRQTDREARLELMGVSDKELPEILTVLADVVGDAVGTEPKTGYD